jgi:hypothetical protein
MIDGKKKRKGQGQVGQKMNGNEIGESRKMRKNFD